jgi:hypothetical protein
MTDEQLREDIKRRVDLMGGLPLQVAGRALGAIAGGYVQSEDAGSPWTEAQVRADAVPDTANQRMAEMEAADPTPDVGAITVGILWNAAVTDGPLWDQDEQASLVEGMRE